MPTARVVLLVVCLALAAVAAAPVTAGAGDRGGARQSEIHIKFFTFRPNDLTVRAGQEIVVTNRDGEHFGEPHSLTSVDGLFDTGVFTTGTRTIEAPAEPGRYKYLCVVHPFMRGVLRVRPAPLL